MSTKVLLHAFEYDLIGSMGVFDLLVGPSIHTRGDANYCDSKLYLIYNKETGVVEEEVKYSPQAYSYLNQLSAEWDARIDSANYDEAGQVALNAIAKASTEAQEGMVKDGTVVDLSSKRKTDVKK